MEILEESYSIQIHSYLVAFSVVILFYDHALTFEKEFTHIWSKPWIKSSTIFLFNRYLGLSGNVTMLVLGRLKELDTKACHIYSVWHQVMLVLSQVLVCVIVSMRIYALYNCSKRILWFLVMFACLLIVVAAWSMTNQSTIDHQQVSVRECQLSMSYPTAIRLSLCWIALFAYDFTLFSLTMYKTWKSKMYRSLATSGSAPILTLLLRDGAAYFMCMALVNLSNILTFYLAPTFLRGSLSTFSSCLSITLVSRMMLNLHCVHAEGGILTTVSGMMFAGERITTNQVLDSMIEVDLPFHQAPSQDVSGRIFMARP
jgi:hypothetical protein